MFSNLMHTRSFCAPLLMLSGTLLAQRGHHGNDTAAQRPQGHDHLPLQPPGETPGIILAVVVSIDEGAEPSVPRPPLAPAWRRFGHVAQALELSQRPPPTGSQRGVLFG